MKKFNFKEYNERLNQQRADLFGVDFLRVMRVDLSVEKMGINKRAHWKEKFSFLIWRADMEVAVGCGTVFLDHLMYPRDDYDRLYGAYRDSVADAGSLRFLKVRGFRFLLEKMLIWIYVCLNPKFYSARQVTQFWDRVNELFYLRKYFKHITPSIDRLIVFCDVHARDNLVVQTAQSFGIRTYTLQHAFFPDISEFDLNIINLVMRQADCALVWGAVSGEIYQKYDDRPVTIVGNPLVEIINDELDAEKVVVYFDNRVGAESNQRLVALLDEFNPEGVDLFYQFHPHDPTEYKFEKAGRVAPAPSNAKWVIAHNTTLLITELFKGKRVLRFEDDFAVDYCYPFRSFKDKDVLSHLFSEENICEADLSELVNNEVTLGQLIEGGYVE